MSTLPILARLLHLLLLAGTGASLQPLVAAAGGEHVCSDACADEFREDQFYGHRGKDLLDDVSKRTFDLARGAARRRMYANAAELFARLERTVLAEKAEEELVRLVANPKARAAVLDLRLDLPVALPGAQSAPPAASPRQWSDAWKHKSENYTVVTNVSEPLAGEIALAMEQMNAYYRDVFRHKRSGGGTSRCLIRVYATREEFDRHEGARPANVIGVYSDAEKRLASYDPRADGRDFDALWTTLFQQASYQFSCMTSSGTVPGWLRFGTATYFEGAELLPDRRVTIGRIPEGRLTGLRAVLAHGKPSLEEVVRYDEPTMYPPAYAPVGWGLVYFFHHYENEVSERVYRTLYDGFMDSYRSGGAHDPVERFVEFFVERAREPGVETLDDLEHRFRAWVLDLYEIEHGDRAFGEGRLLDRARRQAKNGKVDAAIETYGRLIDRGGDQVTARLERADLWTRRKNRDAAVLDLRLAFEVARGARERLVGEERQMADPDRIAQAIRRLDPTFGREIPALFVDVARTAQALADEYDALGHPEPALAIVRRTLVLIGSDQALEDRIEPLKRHVE